MQKSLKHEINKLKSIAKIHQIFKKNGRLDLDRVDLKMDEMEAMLLVIIVILHWYYMHFYQKTPEEI